MLCMVKISIKTQINYVEFQYCAHKNNKLDDVGGRQNVESQI